MKKEVVTPYNKESSKKEQVAEMFNNIAGNYDFLNHFLSMGIDILWRKKAIRILGKDNPQHIVDIATGTGDFALEALSIAPQKITGIDISEKMLEVGREKMKKKKVDHIVEMKLGDSENLPLASDSVDAVTVSFGVRNFENLEKGLAEMHRILKPGCKTVIIEFSKPENFPIKQLYNFYFLNILPAIGKLVSKDPRAYTYLPESVNAFPYGKKFIGIMDKVGYKNVKAIPLTFGIASIYIGEK
ncbi:MAG: bifunctional demethylmenaquinone methyltransferase/2-methoxy-6-polyprenyl-1,4-benzoquinol methylase UbiE [Crocinitomicaceae bacterium]|nr:bifunctional demethylmenaquinone methyltransferase/2-methoxy-6-polyprenyl-1,4-benzoquinol methylase UbiE [Crocinitomicaceae bacterium]|tara:strand:+ start:385 stop:1113 length:729 start_codon:yes stop_codon:yes gene_type:complete